MAVGKKKGTAGSMTKGKETCRSMRNQGRKQGYREEKKKTGKNSRR